MTNESNDHSHRIVEVRADDVARLGHRALDYAERYCDRLAAVERLNIQLNAMTARCEAAEKAHDDLMKDHQALKIAIHKTASMMEKAYEMAANHDHTRLSYDDWCNELRRKVKSDVAIQRVHLHHATVGEGDDKAPVIVGEGTDA